MNRLSDFLFTIARAQALVNDNEVLYVRIVDTPTDNTSNTNTDSSDIIISNDVARLVEV